MSKCKNGENGEGVDLNIPKMPKAEGLGHEVAEFRNKVTNVVGIGSDGAALDDLGGEALEAVLAKSENPESSLLLDTNLTMQDVLEAKKNMLAENNKILQARVNSLADIAMNLPEDCAALGDQIFALTVAAEEKLNALNGSEGEESPISLTVTTAREISATMNYSIIDQLAVMGELNKAVVEVVSKTYLPEGINQKLGTWITGKVDLAVDPAMMQVADAIYAIDMKALSKNGDKQEQTYAKAVLSALAEKKELTAKYEDEVADLIDTENTENRTANADVYLAKVEEYNRALAELDKKAQEAIYKNLNTSFLDELEGSIDKDVELKKYYEEINNLIIEGGAMSPVSDISDMKAKHRENVEVETAEIEYAIDGLKLKDDDANNLKFKRISELEASTKAEFVEKKENAMKGIISELENINSLIGTINKTALGGDEIPFNPLLEIRFALLGRCQERADELKRVLFAIKYEEVTEINSKINNNAREFFKAESFENIDFKSELEDINKMLADDMERAKKYEGEDRLGYENNIKTVYDNLNEKLQEKVNQVGKISNVSKAMLKDIENIKTTLTDAEIAKCFEEESDPQGMADYKVMYQISELVKKYFEACKEFGNEDELKKYITNLFDNLADRKDVISEIEAADKEKEIAAKIDAYNYKKEKIEGGADKTSQAVLATALDMSALKEYKNMSSEDVNLLIYALNNNVLKGLVDTDKKLPPEDVKASNMLMEAQMNMAWGMQKSIGKQMRVEKITSEKFSEFAIKQIKSLQDAASVIEIKMTIDQTKNPKLAVQAAIMLRAIKQMIVYIEAAGTDPDLQDVLKDAGSFGHELRRLRNKGLGEREMFSDENAVLAGMVADLKKQYPGERISLKMLMDTLKKLRSAPTNKKTLTTLGLLMAAASATFAGDLDEDGDDHNFESFFDANNVNIGGIHDMVAAELGGSVVNPEVLKNRRGEVLESEEDMNEKEVKANIRAKLDGGQFAFDPDKIKKLVELVEAGGEVDWEKAFRRLKFDGDTSSVKETNIARILLDFDDDDNNATPKNASDIGNSNPKNGRKDCIDRPTGTNEYGSGMLALSRHLKSVQRANKIFKSIAGSSAPDAKTILEAMANISLIRGFVPPELSFGSGDNNRVFYMTSQNGELVEYKVGKTSSPVKMYIVHKFIAGDKVVYVCWNAKCRNWIVVQDDIEPDDEPDVPTDKPGPCITPGKCPVVLKLRLKACVSDDAEFELKVFDPNDNPIEVKDRIDGKDINKKNGEISVKDAKNLTVASMGKTGDYSIEVYEILENGEKKLVSKGKEFDEFNDMATDTDQDVEIGTISITPISLAATIEVKDLPSNLSKDNLQYRLIGKNGKKSGLREYKKSIDVESDYRDDNGYFKIEFWHNDEEVKKYRKGGKDYYDVASNCIGRKRVGSVIREFKVCNANSISFGADEECDDFAPSRLPTISFSGNLKRGLAENLTENFSYRLYVDQSTGQVQIGLLDQSSGVKLLGFIDANGNEKKAHNNKHGLPAGIHRPLLEINGKKVTADPINIDYENSDEETLAASGSRTISASEFNNADIFNPTSMEFSRTGYDISLLFPALNMKSMTLESGIRGSYSNLQLMGNKGPYTSQLWQSSGIDLGLEARLWLSNSIYINAAYGGRAFSLNNAVNTEYIHATGLDHNLPDTQKQWEIGANKDKKSILSHKYFIFGAGINLWQGATVGGELRTDILDIQNTNSHSSTAVNITFSLAVAKIKKKK